QQSGPEMLIEVRRFGKVGKRKPFAAERWEHQNLAVTAFGIGRENSADAVSVDRLREDQVTGGEVDASVGLGQVQVDDSIAFVRIESDLVQLTRYARGRIGRNEAKTDESQECKET